MSRLCYQLFCEAFWLLALAAVATAQEVPTNNPQRMDENLGRFRVGAFAGAFVPNRLAWTGTGTLAGLPVSGSGHITISPGASGGILIGYVANDYLNFEIDAAASSNGFNKFNGTFSVTGLGTVSGSMPVSGRVESKLAFLNTLFTPTGQFGRVTPFVGGGPGIVYSNAKFNSISTGPATIPVNSSSSEVDFAADGVVGADVNFGHGLSLGVAYVYTWINTKHLGSGTGIRANNGNEQGQIFAVLLEQRF